jgi:hypothetical protein
MADIMEAFEKARAAIHKNCKNDNPKCACACGCDVMLGCACWASVCTDCQMNWMRGRDPEPGTPECDPHRADEPTP